jgi:hypothetical protein
VFVFTERAVLHKEPHELGVLLGVQEVLGNCDIDTALPFDALELETEG